MCIFQLAATIGRRSAIGQSSSVSTARPGRSRPSMNSSDAPPPVDRWSTASARPSRASAAMRVPAARHREPGADRDGVRHRPGALGERLQLEHPHRAVPEERPRSADHVAELVGRARPDVQADRPGAGSPSAGTMWRSAVSFGSAATTKSEGSTTSTPRSFARSQRGQAVPVPVGLHERRAHLDALRGQEREGHRAADQQRVHAVEQRVHHAQLVGDLRAAQDRDERPVGVVAELRRAPRPRAAAAGRPPREAGARPPRRSRAPGAPRRTRRRRRRRPAPPAPRRSRGRSLLSRVEPEVLQQRDRPRSGRVDGRLHGRSRRPRRARARAGPAARRAARRRAPAGTARRPAPFGRPRWLQATTEAPPSSSSDQRRHGRPDAQVLGDPAVLAGGR